jgi:hypothetical protein
VKTLSAAGRKVDRPEVQAFVAGSLGDPAMPEEVVAGI